MQKHVIDAFKELKVMFVMIFIVYLFFQILNMTIIGSNSAISQGIELWVYSMDIIDFLSPLFLTAPFVWVLYYKKKSRFLEYVSVRINFKKYLCTQIMTIVMSVFTLVFLVNFISILLAIFIIPFDIDTDPSIFQIPFLPFAYRTDSVLVFSVGASLWKAVVASVLVFSASVLALTARNLFIVLFGVFAYVIVENILTASIGFDEYSIATSNILGRLNDEYYTLFNMFVGPIMLLIVTFIWVAIYLKRERS